MAIAFLNAANTKGPQLLIFSLDAIVSNTQTSYSVIELFNGTYLGLFKPSARIRIYINPTGVYLIKVIPIP